VSGTCRANSSQNCGTLSQFASTSSLLLDIKKRTADITYNLPNGSLELIDNVSPKQDSAYISPGAYVYVFSRILSEHPKNVPKDQHEFTLESMVFTYCHTASFLSTGGTIARSYIKMLMFPWTIQQHIFKLLSVNSFPVENIIKASYCRRSYKVTLAPSSFYTFTIFCLLTIAWSLSQLISTIAIRTPVSTLFPDVDLWTRSLPDGDRNGVFSGLPPKFTSLEAERELWDKRIKVEPTKRAQWDTANRTGNELS
jgi:hypothetical protein